MAHEHLEARELGEIDLVRPEEEAELRPHHVGDAARLRIAEHQPAHPRGRHVHDVEAVPVRLYETQRIDQLQRSRLATLQRTATDDYHRTFCFSECLGHRLGQIAKQRQIVAEPFDLVRQIRLRPDREDLRALLDRLADPRVHQRRFPAQIGAHQQDRIGTLGARDRRVETDRGDARRVIVHAGLTAFEQRRTHLRE
jgi:hypothetical protein